MDGKSDKIELLQQPVFNGHSSKAPPQTWTKAEDQRFPTIQVVTVETRGSNIVFWCLIAVSAFLLIWNWRVRRLRPTKAKLEKLHVEQTLEFLRLLNAEENDEVVSLPRKHNQTNDRLLFASLRKSKEISKETSKETSNPKQVPHPPLDQIHSTNTQT